MHLWRELFFGLSKLETRMVFWPYLKQIKTALLSNWDNLTKQKNSAKFCKYHMFCQNQEWQKNLWFIKTEFCASIKTGSFPTGHFRCPDAGPPLQPCTSPGWTSWLEKCPLSSFSEEIKHPSWHSTPNKSDGCCSNMGDELEDMMIEVMVYKYLFLWNYSLNCCLIHARAITLKN